MKDKALPRLGRGELLALVGAFGLWPTLFADWFALETDAWMIHPDVLLRWSGWMGLGWPIDVLVCLAIATGLVLAGAGAPRRGVAAQWAIAFGSIAFVAIAAGVLTERHASIRWPALVALVFSALIPLGGLLARGHARRDPLS